MCGIAGYVAKKENIEFARNKFTEILLAGEVRGTDACGVAFNIGKKKFYYCKAPAPASKFIKENVYKELMRDYAPNIMIGHNRAQTQGDKENNYNNHPIVTKTGLSLIHNGMIHNDKELAKEYSLAPDGEVDSEVIVRMIEYFIYVKGKNTRQAIIEMANKVRGSMAIALLNAKEPQSVYLLASGNPINLAYHRPTGTIFFASTETILESGLAEYEHFFKGLFKKSTGTDDYIFEKIADDTGLRITPQGWEAFEVERPTYQTNYTNYNWRDDDSYNRSGNFEKVGATIYKRSGGEIYSPHKPIYIEARNESIIIDELSKIKDFDVADVIKKPSGYLSELLLYRLEYIQEMLFSGDYETEEDELGMIRLENEIRRIILTLSERQKKTKRKLYIPTYQEIMLCLDGSELGRQYTDVEWVLAKKNKDLYNTLKNADGFSEMGYFNEDEEETDSDTPPSDFVNPNQTRLLCD